ncbi:hypothetical protein ABZV58_34415 [Nocardia sp. NPDC004654]|uniref:hypothetical protein n=1 Tax=Nocardia sp. NPDC004654 TaxID=3154776 RepID=UPI0033AFE545
MVAVSSGFTMPLRRQLAAAIAADVQRRGVSVSKIAAETGASKNSIHLAVGGRFLDRLGVDPLIEICDKLGITVTLEMISAPTIIRPKPYKRGDLHRPRHAPDLTMLGQLKEQLAAAIGSAIEEYPGGATAIIAATGISGPIISLLKNRHPRYRLDKLIEFANTFGITVQIDTSEAVAC